MRRRGPPRTPRRPPRSTTRLTRPPAATASATRSRRPTSKGAKPTQARAAPVKRGRDERRHRGMRAIWITSDHMALVRAYWYMCEHCGICSRQTEQGAAAETAPVKRGRDERRHQPTKGRVPWLWQMDCLIKGVLVYVRILLNNGRPFPFDFTLYPLL